jgi:citrate synthase
VTEHGERQERDPVVGRGTATDTAIADWSDRVVAYRGYDVLDLVRESTFTEVAFLLLCGELPDDVFLADFRATLAESSEGDGWDGESSWMSDLLDRLPLSVPLSDILRTAISVVSHFDPQPSDRSVEADRSRSIRLLGRVPMLVAGRLALSRGETRIEPDSERSFPAQLVALLTGRVPSPVLERAVDVLLISVIDVGFSPAVQAARLAAAAGADIHGAVLAAASVESTAERAGLAARLVELWSERPWKDDAEGWVLERLDAGLGVPGCVFGGQATDDPRRVTCVAWSEHLAAESDDESALTIDRAAAELESAVIACGGVPGWDWSTIRLLAAGGVESGLHLPLVAVARLLGWSAHVLEQFGRPVASVSRPHYVGPHLREIPARPVWD